MAENLKTTRYRNGDPIPNVTDNTAWSALTTGAYCWYNNDAATYQAAYGALYNWYSVSDSRNVCPTGWHVPTDAEWTNLTTYLGGDNAAGGPLKETCFTHWTSPNTGATNSAGFTALPGGVRDANGILEYVGGYGYWWSSTAFEAIYAWSRYLNYTGANISHTFDDRRNGLSVRCVLGESTILTVPTLNTATATVITTNSASSGGTITSDGGAAVTSRGVCWSTTSGPTTVNNITSDGTGTGIFTSTITGLTAGETYYVRAYATNSSGTAYGNEVTFTTVAVNLPTLTTLDISCSNSTSASIGGNISSDGGSAITARGVCWSTTSGPTTANSKTSDGTGSGSFPSIMTRLTGGTTYYVRAYATNSSGTSYGNEVSFTTVLASFPNCGTVTDIDGNVYNTVTIGTQCWMAENLQTTRYRNGDPIPNVTDNIAWGALTTGAYCWYNNDAATYQADYGALYNWYTVADSRNVCPTGWHVPTDTEWATLTTFLGGENVAGGSLKETCFNHWNSPNTGATNLTGFTALPGGLRAPVAGWIGFIYDMGFWWSSSEYDINNGSYVKMYSSDSSLNWQPAQKQHGASVRCVRDF